MGKGAAEEAEDVAAAFDESGRVVGAEEDEKSTRETRTVRFRRIR